MIGISFFVVDDSGSNSAVRAVVSHSNPKNEGFSFGGEGVRSDEDAAIHLILIHHEHPNSTFGRDAGYCHSAEMPVTQ